MHLNVLFRDRNYIECNLHLSQQNNTTVNATNVKFHMYTKVCLNK